MQESPIGVLESASADRTRVIGRQLGQLLQAGDVVGLQGGLGAGKTCLTQGIAVGMQIEQDYRVTSPTFTLINEYPGRLPLAHIDLYRLTDEDEIWEIGVPDYMGGEGVCVIEWFEQCGAATPGDYLRIEMTATGDESRRLSIFARGARHLDLGRTWWKRS